MIALALVLVCLSGDNVLRLARRDFVEAEFGRSHSSIPVAVADTTE
jgi:hypothetical protein